MSGCMFNLNFDVLFKTCVYVCMCVYSPTCMCWTRDLCPKYAKSICKSYMKNFYKWTGKKPNNQALEMGKWVGHGGTHLYFQHSEWKQEDQELTEALAT